MAAYPSIGYQHTVTPSEHRIILTASDGSPRARDYQTVQWYRVELVHPVISGTDKDSILTFYDTNKDAWNTWTELVTSTVYEFLFENRPAFQHVAGDRWTVQSNLVAKVQ